MNPPSQARFVVAGGLLVNAIVAAVFARDGAEMEWGSTVIGIGIIGVLLLALALRVVINPSRWPLRLSRGVAASVIVCLALVSLLVLLAVNFESGMGQKKFTSAVGSMVALLIAQFAIIVGAERIDRVGFAKSIPSTINGGFVVWGIAIAVLLIASVFSD